MKKAIIGSVTLIMIGIISCVSIICSTPEVIQYEYIDTNEKKYEDYTYSSLHDWECKYIITDNYSCEKSTIHYVNEMIENVDGSITFISEDGKLVRIPYPYYSIEENPKENH